MSETGAQVIDMGKFLASRRERSTERAAPSGEFASDVVSLVPPQKASGIFADPASRTAQLGSLLGEIDERISRAEEYARSGDMLEAANALVFCGPLVEEAFCFRDLSDGLGMVLTATLAALRNLVGPPSLDGLRAMLSVMRTLLNGPYVSDDTAIELTEALEDAGWNPFRVELEHVLDSGDREGDSDDNS